MYEDTRYLQKESCVHCFCLCSPRVICIVCIPFLLVFSNTISVSQCMVSTDHVGLE